jgi:hypothetical protein
VPQSRAAIQFAPDCIGIARVTSGVQHQDPRCPSAAVVPLRCNERGHVEASRPAPKCARRASILWKCRCSNFRLTVPPDARTGESSAFNAWLACHFDRRMRSAGGGGTDCAHAVAARARAPKASRVVVRPRSVLEDRTSARLRLDLDVADKETNEPRTTRGLLRVAHRTRRVRYHHLQ